MRGTSWTGPVALAAGREVRERLRTKSYYAITAVLVLAVLAFGVATRVVGEPEQSVTVGITAATPEGFTEVAQGVASSLDWTLEVRPLEDSAARRALADGDVDAVVIGEDQALLIDGDLDQTVQAIVQQAWAAASVNAALLDAGLTPQQAATALSPPPLELTRLHPEDALDDTGTVAGTVVAILLFMSLQLFGGYVLAGVVEEKSSAVVEVLLARMSATQLLAGKLIGTGIAGLGQFAVVIGAGLASLAISGASVPAEVWTALPMAVVWFLGGFALYSTLFALAGSLVSRQEDAQAASAPVITVMLLAYMVVFPFSQEPDSTAATVLSLLPPFAPLMMPMRMATGAAGLPEVLVALVLLAGAIVGVWALAGAIYEQVLLRRGSRIRWGEALRTIRPTRG